MTAHLSAPAHMASSAHNVALRLTLEGLTAASVINTFRNTFPKVSEYLDTTVGIFGSSQEETEGLKPFAKALDTAKATASKINFMTYRTVPLPCPQGLDSKLVAYLTHLNKDATEHLKQSQDFLEDYYRVLATFISNKAAKTGLADHTVAYQKVDAVTIKGRKDLDSYFTAKRDTGLLPASALLDRMADVDLAFTLARSIDRTAQAFRSKDILEKVKRISELLHLVIEQSKEKTIDNVSSAAVNNLAQGALVVAHYVEYLAVIRYRMEEAVKATGLMAEKISQHKA